MSLNFGSERRLQPNCRGLAFLAVDRLLLDREDPPESRNAARAELCPGRAPQLLEGLGRRPGGAVDARREHRVERVRDVDDACTQRDVLTLETVGIAGSVVALVVVPDRRDGVVQEAEAIDDARPVLRVLLTQPPVAVVVA